MNSGDSKNSHFDPNRKYTDDKYSITGDALNDICDLIKSLETEISNSKAKVLEEELTNLRLRDRNPALKEAWDQYLTVKALTKT